MARQTDEQFLQEHYQWFQKSYHWHDKAVSLRAMANALYSKALPGLRRYEKARNVALKELQHRSIVPIKAVEPDVLPAIALYGVALENAFKGLMVSKDLTLIGARKLSPKLRSHKLVELARDAGISLSPSEERATHMFHPLDNVTLESTRSKFQELRAIFARIEKALPRRRMRLRFGALVRLDD